MKATILDIQQLTKGQNHSAFTSCAHWRNAWYVACREAPTHSILPAGVVRLWRSEDTQHWDPCATLYHGTARWPRFSSLRQRASIAPLYDLTGDCRDPKLIADPEALFCIVGTYLPKFPRATLHERSAENIIQSHITYTQDGEHWTPLRPIARPGYWIWSAIPLKRSWIACAYHTGTTAETSSLHLLAGTSLLDLGPLAMMYDGSSTEKDGLDLRYRHFSPSEPVLYQSDEKTLACLMRTESCMEVGVSRSIHQDWLQKDWRYHDTRQLIHPSSIIKTKYGWLMTGREILKTVAGNRTHYEYHTTLWQVHGQHVTRLQSMPSSGDTGYCGICEGKNQDEYILSYYSQHTVGTRFSSTFPGSHVFVARIRVEAAL